MTTDVSRRAAIGSVPALAAALSSEAQAADGWGANIVTDNGVPFASPSLRGTSKC